MTITRPRYEASNGTSLARLPHLIAGGLLLACLVAVVLSLFFQLNMYVAIVVPLIVAAGAGAALRPLVGWTKCHHPVHALLLGGSIGFAGLLGYYYLSSSIIDGELNNPLKLPQRIMERMESDKLLGFRPRRSRNVPMGARDPLTNWIALMIESGLLIGIPAAFGWFRASRPFYSPLQMWFTRESKPLSSGLSPELIKALESNAIEAMVPKLVTQDLRNVSGELILDYITPKNKQSALEFPIYLTVRENGRSQNNRRQNQSASGFLPSKQEVLALLPMFPDLAELLGNRHQEISSIVEIDRAAIETLPSVEGLPTERAVKTPLPTPLRKQLHANNYKWINQAFRFVPLVVFACGFGLIVLSGWMFTIVNAPNILLKLIGVLVVFLMGGSALLVGGYAVFLLPGVSQSFWLRRRLRYLIRQRPGQSNWGMDAETLFVGLVPRENLVQVRENLTSDFLFAKVDTRKRTLTLIGDSDNYQIPVDSILEMNVHEYYMPMDVKHDDQMWYFAMKTLFVGDRLQELILLPQYVSWRPCSGLARMTSVKRFYESINNLKTKQTKEVQMKIAQAIKIAQRK